ITGARTGSAFRRNSRASGSAMSTPVTVGTLVGDEEPCNVRHVLRPAEPSPSGYRQPWRATALSPTSRPRNARRGISPPPAGVIMYSPGGGHMQALHEPQT